MQYVCRLAKKFKIIEGMYLLKVTDLKEGTIDENGNFAVVNDDDTITRYPSYRKSSFYNDENLEYCYCCEEEMEEVVAASDSMSKIGAIDDYKKGYDNIFYLIKYDKKTDNCLKCLPLDLNVFDDIITMLESFQQTLNANLGNNGMYMLMPNKDLENVSGTKNVEVFQIVGFLDKNMANIDGLENLENLEDIDLYDKSKINKNNMDPYLELNKLIGIKDIKNNVDKLSNYLLYLNTIKEQKLDIELEKPNLNMVFLGNPGTGKTTVARIISSILSKLGYANGKFEEVSAKDLIADYVGQTATKTERVIKSVKGGVLFIDEAYSLASGDSGASFSQDALAVLLKEMENNETIFIFSGYKKEMEDFINLNSGFSSRISKTYIFNDYSEDELLEMFINKVNKSKLKINNSLLDTIKEIIITAKTQENFGNGRFIDKLFDDIVMTHANNVSNSNNKDELITITSKDINNESIDKIIYKNAKTKKIGF